MQPPLFRGQSELTITNISVTGRCKSGSINITAYNAIQNIKYSLKASEQTAVE